MLCSATADFSGWCKEHQMYIFLHQPQKSAVAKHSVSMGHCIFGCTKSAANCSICYLWEDCWLSISTVHIKIEAFSTSSYQSMYFVGDESECKYLWNICMKVSGNCRIRCISLGLPGALLISHSLAVHSVCTWSYNVTNSHDLKALQDESGELVTL
jgi:hypothetical protein